MEVEVTHITKDAAGEWRDIGALMDQWIRECPNNHACVKGGDCEFERYQYGYWPVCWHPRYREIFAGIPSMCCNEDLQWVEWSKAIAEVENISPERLARWKQLWVSYSRLPEEHKEADRKYARRVLKHLLKSKLMNVHIVKE